jgi:hypothetical protein
MTWQVAAPQDFGIVTGMVDAERCSLAELAAAIAADVDQSSVLAMALARRAEDEPDAGSAPEVSRFQNSMSARAQPGG